MKNPLGITGEDFDKLMSDTAKSVVKGMREAFNYDESDSSIVFNGEKYFLNKEM